MQRADRILKDIENTNISLLDGRQLKVSLSAGIVSSIRITTSTETNNIIQHVIEAVAHAKRNGKSVTYSVHIRSPKSPDFGLLPNLLKKQFQQKERQHPGDDRDQGVFAEPRDQDGNQASQQTSILQR